MEETVDPILAKLNGKSKQKPVTVAEEDPILSRLNASKKKEPTVSEVSGEVGTREVSGTQLSQPSNEEVQRHAKNLAALGGFNPKTPEQLQKEKSIADMQERRAKQTVKSFQEEITGKREYDGLVDETTQKLAAIPPSFNKGVVSAAAALPKGVGILAQKLDQLTGAPEKPIEEYATYQLGDFIDKKAAEVGITTIDQMNAGFGNSTVPMAFGQMFGMLLSGGPSAAAEGLIPQSIAKQTAKTLSSPMAVSGALQASVPEFEAAKQAGKTDEEAFNVFLKNIPGGLTEVLPIANMFGRLNKMTGNGIVNAFKASTAQGLEEGSQEAVQTFLTNKIAQGSYDPKRDLQQGILEGAGTGFLVGFLMPGIMGAMAKMTPDQKAETQSIIENKLKTPVIPEPIVSPAQVVSEVRTSVKSADDTQGAEIAAEKILEATQQENQQPDITNTAQDEPTSLRGVKYSDIIVGDQRLDDILDENKLSNVEKNKVRDIFSRGVDYFKFDQEGEQRFQEKFANPEDITDVADVLLTGLSAAKESAFNFYNQKNYDNVKDAINYIVQNPNEYSPNIVKAVSAIKQKLDNSSSMNRLYAIDVMKELGIKTQLPNATEGQQLTTQTDGQERDGQGRQEVLTAQNPNDNSSGFANLEQFQIVKNKVIENINNRRDATFFNLERNGLIKIKCD